MAFFTSFKISDISTDYPRPNERITDKKLIDTKNGTEFTFAPTKKGTYKIVATVGGQKISEFSVVVKTSEKTVRAVSGGVTSAVAFSAVAAVLIIVIVKMLKRRA